MKKKILLTDEIMKEFIDVYKEYFIVDTLWNLEKKKINYKDYEGIVASGGFKIPKIFYKKLTNLKIISLFAVGFDNVDLNICKKNNIIVSNTPNVLTTDVADLALTLILSISRNLINGHNHVKNNIWQNKGPMDLTDSIHNKKLGIVGLGNIGREVAKKAKILSMQINYYSPTKKKVKYKFYKNLQKMAGEVDYLVITCKGGKETNKLIDNKILQSMKKNSYLINVSRGTVVDEDALLKVLKKNKIKGAALDVFLNEPKIKEDFKKLNNIILHPHHGSGTYETRKSMAKLSCLNLVNYFKKGRPIHKAN